MALSASEIKSVNISNNCGYILHIHTTDNKTITRRIEAREAREYFRINDTSAQISYIVELFNESYQQTQPKAPRFEQTPQEERYHTLLGMKRINPLSVDEQEELNELEAEIYPTFTF